MKMRTKWVIVLKNCMKKTNERKWKQNGKIVAFVVMNVQNITYRPNDCSDIWTHIRVNWCAISVSIGLTLGTDSGLIRKHCTQRTDQMLNRKKVLKNTRDSEIECREKGCKYRTKFKASYSAHIRTHTRPHICPQCSKGFSRQYLVKEHMSVHSHQYKIKCEWYECDRLFNNKEQMKMHMNIHTAEETYPCEWPGCEKMLKLKTGWNSHMMRHKGKNMYVCKLCDYRTTNTIGYRSHMKKHENQSIWSQN